MTIGSALRAGFLASAFTLGACHSDAKPDPGTCNLGDQHARLADVVTTLSFNPNVLDQLGVTVQSVGAIATAPQHALSILPGPASTFDGTSECLAVDVVDGHLEDFVRGRIAHTGGPTLSLGERAVNLDGFELRVGDEPRTLEIVTASGERVLRGTLPHYEIASGVLDVFNVDLTATPALAAKWDAPHVAGTVVGTLALRAQVTPPALAATTSALGGKEEGPFAPCGDWSGNVDVALIAMDAVQQQGRLNDRVVITPSAILKNVGTANVPWQRRFSGNQPPYNIDQHPFLVWALFRESGGVFEPLAYSDVKHAFLTINSNCSPGACTNNQVLGLGCEDVYGVGTNGTHLAPRSEILPRAGTWAHCNFPAPNTPSHFDLAAPFCSEDNNGGTEDVLTHRAVASDAELSVTGASYYFTSWYVVRDDINIFNSMGWRKINPTRNGNTWSFAFGSAFRNGSVLDAFVDPAVPNPNRLNATYRDPSGAVQIAVTATDLGNERWRYVYVLMNHDFDPKISALTLPIGNVLVEQVTFADGDDSAGNNWLFSGGVGQLSWAAPTNSARLSWSTALTITFVANGGPLAATARVTRSDNGGALFVKTLVPDRISI